MLNFDLHSLKAFLFAVSVPIAALSLTAAKPAADEPMFRSEPPSFGAGTVGSMLQVLLALGLVLALIILLLRFLSKRSRLFQASNGMTRLAGIQLGPNKSLQVIECGGHLYVLGVGEDIRLIDKISSPEEIERWKAVLEAGTQGTGLFSLKALTRGLRRLSGRTSLEGEEYSPERNAAFQELLYSKMRQVNEDKRRRLQDLLQADDAEDRPDKP